MGALRQDRTRPYQLRFLLLALVTFGVVAGSYAIEARRTAALARVQHAQERRDLDARFGREKLRIEKQFQEFRNQALRAVAAGDRRALPVDVVSASTWERAADGWVRAGGFAAEGTWEQALYRVLPAELARRTSMAVLPLVGPELAGDPNAETLRLGVFPEGDGKRVVAIAFRPRALFAGLGDSVKEYLIDDSGLILAHHRASEVGSRTSALADLYRNAAGSGTAEHRLTSKSWEGFPVTVRFARLPGWNAFLVLEKAHPPIVQAASPVFLGILFVGGLLGIAFLGLAAWAKEPRASTVPAAAVAEAVVSAPARPAPPPRRGLRELRANPPPFVARPSAISLAAPAAPDVPSELGKFIAAREARSETHEQNRIRREKILLEDFEAEARRVRGAEALEEKLVGSVSGATRSPVLFFRYDPRQGIARLAAEAGYPAAQSILGAGGMSFALGADLVTDIHAAAARGRPLNLWEHAPLARVMMARLGIANFEAWPMSESRAPSAGPSRLLGVLVVAESGVDSVLHRDFLGSLLERASRHYPRQNA